MRSLVSLAPKIISLKLYIHSTKIDVSIEMRPLSPRDRDRKRVKWRYKSREHIDTNSTCIVWFAFEFDTIKLKPYRRCVGMRRIEIWAREKKGIYTTQWKRRMTGTRLIDNFEIRRAMKRDSLGHLNTFFFISFLFIWFHNCQKIIILIAYFFFLCYNVATHLWVGNLCRRDKKAHFLFEYVFPLKKSKGFLNIDTYKIYIKHGICKLWKANNRNRNTLFLTLWIDIVVVVPSITRLLYIRSIWKWFSIIICVLVAVIKCMICIYIYI